MQPLLRPLTIYNLFFRLCQIIGATACVVLYGKYINRATQDDKYVDSKWMFATVVSSLALASSFIYFLCAFFFEWRAPIILASWDLVLTILWAAVAGVFGSMYIGENPEMDAGIKKMQMAVYFDIANVLLWAITGAVGVWFFFVSKGRLLHEGRGKMPGKA